MTRALRYLLCLFLDHKTTGMPDSGTVDVIYTTDAEDDANGEEYGVAVCWCERCEWPVVRVLKMSPALHLVSKELA